MNVLSFAVLALLAPPAPPATPTPTPQARPLLGHVPPAAATRVPSVSAEPRSLADVARERRGKTKPKGAFSAADSTAPTLDVTPAEKEGSDKEGAAKEGAVKDGAAAADREEKMWRRRMERLRESADHADEDLKKAEDALKSGAFITQGNSMTAEAKAEMDRRRQTVESGKKRVADSRQRIAEAEEEARHEGVPPGWIR